MVQITVTKNGHDITYNIYNTNEYLIIPNIQNPTTLNLPSNYKCVGTNPLTFQNITPVVVDLTDINCFMNQEYFDSFIPFGYKISKQDYEDFEQIVMQNDPYWKNTKMLETEENLSQIKYWACCNLPQQSQTYQQPQLPAYEQQIYQQPQLPAYGQQYYNQSQLPTYGQQTYQQPQLPTYGQQTYQQPQLPAYGQQTYNQPQGYVKTY